MTTTHPLQITTAHNYARAAKEAIEGPTRKQVARMVALRQRKLAAARQALADHNDDLAFTLDCDAFDIECTLTTYLYDPNTGRRVSR